MKIDSLKAITGVVMLVFLVGGCKPSSGSFEEAGPALKISVFTNNTFSVNGSLSSLPDLKKAIDNLKSQKGTIRNYRQDGEKEPPPITMDILPIMTTSGLAIRLFSRPDYSGPVGEGGRVERDPTEWEPSK